MLATTNRRDSARPISPPANARLVEWLSYARAMPRCAAIVCHAGHGTVARALASSVPVVACPFAGDMAENAARVRWAGVGVSLPRRFQTPRGVRIALRRLLADPRHADRARRARRLVAAQPRSRGGGGCGGGARAALRGPPLAEAQKNALPSAESASLQGDLGRHEVAPAGEARELQAGMARTGQAHFVAGPALALLLAAAAEAAPIASFTYSPESPLTGSS